MPHSVDATEWRGRTIVDPDGDPIGRLEDVYIDAETGLPEWGLVSVGLFRLKRTFVPLTDAHADHDEVQVPFDRSRVRRAPGSEPDGELSRADEAKLYRHYGLDYGEPAGARLQRYVVQAR